MPIELVATLLRDGQRTLAGAGIESAALDARVLLQAAAGLQHEDIIADPDRMVSEPVNVRYAGMLARRILREPVSRILGEREFYGRVFSISPDTLDPRPDTETLVEVALALLPRDRQAAVLDLGTGTGAIIVSLLAECPQVVGVGTDFSAAALNMAWANAERHGVLPRLSLVHGDWFDGIAGRFDLIVSNPPYIAEGTIESLSAEVKNNDPRMALSGGEDGLVAFRHIAAGARFHLRPGSPVAVEIGSGQEPDVTAIFEESGFQKTGATRDIARIVRVLTFIQT